MEHYTLESSNFTPGWTKLLVSMDLFIFKSNEEVIFLLAYFQWYFLNIMFRGSVSKEIWSLIVAIPVFLCFYNRFQLFWIYANTSQWMRVSCRALVFHVITSNTARFHYGYVLIIGAQLPWNGITCYLNVTETTK